MRPSKYKDRDRAERFSNWREFTKRSLCGEGRMYDYCSSSSWSKTAWNRHNRKRCSTKLRLELSALLGEQHGASVEEHAPLS